MITWVLFKADHGGGHMGHTEEYVPFMYEMSEDDLQCELESWTNDNFNNAHSTGDFVTEIPLEAMEELISKYAFKIRHYSDLLKDLRRRKAGG